MTDSVKLCTRRESLDLLTMPNPIEPVLGLVNGSGLVNGLDLGRG